VQHGVGAAGIQRERPRAVVEVGLQRHRDPAALAQAAVLAGQHQRHAQRIEGRAQLQVAPAAAAVEDAHRLASALMREARLIR
jgi:hypothetical protein